MALVKRMDSAKTYSALGVAGCLMFGGLLAMWQRIVDAVAGRTVYSLSACLAAAAAGIVAGLVLAWWPCRRLRTPIALMRGVLLAGAVWLALQLAALPWLVGAWQHLLTDSMRAFSDCLLILGKTAVVLVGVPCVLAGLAVQGAWQSRRAAALPGLLAGTGALIVGYALGRVAVSFVSAEAFLRLAALWFGVLSSVAVLCRRSDERRTAGRMVWACLPIALVIAALCAVRPQRGASVLSEGMIGRLVHRDSGFASGTPLFAHSSFRHTVTVYADPDYRFVFALDGRPVLFGNRFHTSRTLTGYVPLLIRPGCKKAVVLGAEAGLYLPFFARAGVADLGFAGADSAAVNLAVAADAYLTGDDACEKAALHKDAALRPTSAYDIIFLANEPVWMRGDGTCYGRRWFERCRRALSADGIVALHLDARALLPERFASVASDFSAVFPGVQLWCTGAYDWLLVGSAGEIKAPVDKMQTLFERTPVFRDFVRAGGLALPETLACMVCDGTRLAPWLSKTRHVSMERAEWLATRRLFKKERGFLQPAMLETCRQWRSQWILPGEMDVDVYLALLDKVGKNIGARVAAVKAFNEMAEGRRDQGLNAAREAATVNVRDALLIGFSEALELEGRRRVNLGDLKGGLKCFENLLSFSTGSAFSNYGMGLCLRGTGDNEGAYLHFARAVSAAPEQLDYRLEMAQSALAIGEFAEADRQYLDVLKREPDNPAVLFLAAKALAWHERPQKDMATALKWAERACVLTKWKNQEYAFGLADLYMEAGRVLEGMGLKRRLKEGDRPMRSVKP